MKTIAFFNDRGGVGKTSLVYHLGWMLADLGYRVVVADLDPQASLTAMLLGEERLEDLWDVWEEGNGATTILGAVEPLRRAGEVLPAMLVSVNEQLALLPGDVALSSFDGVSADGWAECHRADPRGLAVVSCFARVLARSAVDHAADLVLVDVGSSLGALTRSTLLAADHVVIPVVADLFSIVGLRNLGSTLGEWRNDWRRLLDAPSPTLELPTLELPRGELQAMGYVTMQHAIRKESRATKAYQRWWRRIPRVYRESVLGLEGAAPESIVDDPECLAVLKNHHSLMAMAEDAHKPMFRLTPADGAMGSHAHAVLDVHRDFEQLARTIAQRSGVAR